jgi:hypothetical protein
MRSGVQPAASTIRLGHRGDVEARAELGQELEDLRRRVGLHGVEHLRVGQRLGEGEIVLAHHVEVEHEAGSFVVRRFREFADACGHLELLPIRMAAQAALR